MNQEHTIVGGADKIADCGKYVAGYTAKCATIADGKVTQVHVAKLGLTAKVVSYAALNLWTVGDNLKFRIERNVAVNGPILGIMPNPLDSIMCVLGFPLEMLMMALDSRKQTKLEERLHLVASTFLTAS